MALVVGGVAVDLTANAAQITAAMNQAARSVQTAAAQMQGTTSKFANSFNAAERSVNASVGRIGSAFRSLQGTLAGLGLALGAREIIRYADAYKLVQAQLTLVTGSAEEAAAIQERLFQSAQTLGVGVDALNQIFIRTARNAESLGVSQEEIIQTTEALGAAVKISGASAAEAQNALIQLSQAFSSGVLRGDELRSIGEQLPVVLDAVAEATNKTRNEVISFARENGLAADLVVASVNRMRDTWVLQAASMGDTVETAMTRIDSAIRRVAGKAGEEGAFQPLIDSLNELGRLLESGPVVSSLAAFAAAVVDAVRIMLSEFADLAEIIHAVFEGRFSDAFAVVERRALRFVDAAKSAISGNYVAAVETAIGKTEALGTAISKVQIGALYPGAAVGAAASRTANPTSSAPLTLRSGPPTAAELEKIARATEKAREAIANLTTSGDEFVQIQQNLGKKSRDLGETFQEFTKYVKDADERSEALGATLAALAVEEEAAAKKIRDTLTEVRLIAETAGLEGIDLGSQAIRDAVGQLGEMASANDDVFKTQLALAASTQRLGELFQTLSTAMIAAGASGEEINKLRGIILSAQAGAEEAASKAETAPSIEAAKAAAEALKEKYEGVNAVAQDFAGNVSKGFTDAIFGAQTFGEALQGVISALIQAVVQALILQGVMLALGTAGGGGGLLGAIFARQHGGPVDRNRPYMVGEKGPELFVPSRSGQIVPNNALGGGGSGGGIVLTINAQGAQRGVGGEIIRAVRNPATARALAEALGPVYAGTPSLRQAIVRR